MSTTTEAAPSNPGPNDTNVGRTAGPHLEQVREVLDRQLGRIRRRFLLHGLCTVAALALLLFGVYFALDRGLRLPATVRIVVTLGIVAALAWAFRRFLIYPLTRQVSRADVALVLERHMPQLDSSWISAWQLGQLSTFGRTPTPADVAKSDHAPVGSEPLRGQSAAMIERVVEDAAREAESLPLAGLFANGTTSRITVLTSVLAVCIGVMAWIEGPATLVFIKRMFGAGTPYPRATTLRLELPPESNDLRMLVTQPGSESARREVQVVLAAGGDLPIIVRAEGAVPREIFLHREDRNDERQMPMTPRGEGRFRAVFRRIQGPFSFWTSGGDDDGGDTFVTVTVIEPPAVGRILARITPPDYTRQPMAEQPGGNVECLDGSSIALEIDTTTAVQEAVLAFESGEELPLTPLRVEDDAAQANVWGVEFVALQSDRYHIRLIGDRGLSNPDPGSYAVTVLTDHSPTGRFSSPQQDELSLFLEQAVVPVRLTTDDDFGLATVDLVLEVGEQDSQRVNFATLGEPSPDGPPPPTSLMFARGLEVADLAASADSGRLATLRLSATLTDIRAPEAQITELPFLQVEIVDAAQLNGAITRHFRGIREEVERATELQSDRAARLSDNLDATGLPQDTSDLRTWLTTIEVGQGRVAVLAERMHRSLMRAFDVHLFNRLETSKNAPEALRFYFEWHRANPDPKPQQPDFYRALSERRKVGELGALEGVLDDVLGMIEIADRMASRTGPEAVRRTTEAQVSIAARDRLQAALLRVGELQSEILTDLERRAV